MEKNNKIAGQARPDFLAKAPVETMFCLAEGGYSSTDFDTDISVVLGKALIVQPNALLSNDVLKRFNKYKIVNDWTVCIINCEPSTNKIVETKSQFNLSDTVSDFFEMDLIPYVSVDSQRFLSQDLTWIGDLKNLFAEDEMQALDLVFTHTDVLMDSNHFARLSTIAELFVDKKLPLELCVALMTALFSIKDKIETEYKKLLLYSVGEAKSLGYSEEQIRSLLHGF